MYNVERQYTRPASFQASNWGMYTIKSIVESCEFGPQMVNVSSPETRCPAEAAAVVQPIEKCGDLNKLERRQEKLFEQLEHLAVKLKVIKESLHLSPANLQATALPHENVNLTTIPSTVVITHSPKDSNLGIVIMMSPNRKSFAFFVVCNWLTRAGFSVSIASHVHSSVHTLQHESFRKLLCDIPISTQSEIRQRSKCHLMLRLIWKEVGPDLKVIVSPTTNGIVTGEVNLLRYFASAFLPSLRCEDDPIKATMVDDWLDVAHSFVKHDAMRNERKTVLDSIDSQLRKTEYLVEGDQPSAADVAMLSALLHEPSTAFLANLPGNVRKWVITLCCDSGVSFALNAMSIKLA